MKSLAIIDGDHIVYRAAGSCEPTKIKPTPEPCEDAIYRANQLMVRILHNLGDPDYELYISGECNWRYALYPEYKANRKDKPKPRWLEEVRAFLITNWNAQIVNNIEVDDMCGIRMTQETNA